MNVLGEENHQEGQETDREVERAEEGKKTIRNDRNRTEKLNVLRQKKKNVFRSPKKNEVEY